MLKQKNNVGLEDVCAHKSFGVKPQHERDGSWVDIDADPDAEVNMMWKEHITLESAQRAKLVMTKVSAPQVSVYMQKRQ
ncbi:putative phospholipid-transporting ATPase IB [Platysternon megacephalum]|uniref:Putative phospholipid-transporting ATPase IB n=1 Tax=Platysternon megacephalum TaxID=55544 RepID=A0A4D9ET70_9SAUR|nr:putative phospholipid-transporting ATPase IB [Platysternon megacephalum]